MGIQAYVKLADLKTAGAQIETVEHVVHNDEEGSKFIFKEAKVTLPGDMVLWFHVSRGGDEVWIDANHWGDTRNTHLAPLEALGVSWTEH